MGTMGSARWRWLDLRCAGRRRRQRNGVGGIAIGRLRRLGGDGTYKAISLCRNSEDVSRIFNLIVQDLANFAHSNIDCRIRIDESLAAPQLPYNFFPAHKVSVAGYQKKKQLQRNPFQPYVLPRTPEFKRPRIQLELIEGVSRFRHPHRKSYADAPG